MTTSRSLSRRLVNQYKQRFGLTSSYQVAKSMGVQLQAVRNWEKGHRTMSAAVAVRIAAELGLDVGATVAALERERLARGRSPLKKGERHGRQAAQLMLLQ